MIVVIADDISGAAELAGVARGHGLGAEVQTQFCPDSNAQVVAIDADTRSLPVDQAVGIVRNLTTTVVGSGKPSWIYKKTDSVLRGHVAAECHAIAAAAGCSKILFIPANPGRKRIIRDGNYFVNDVPLHLTEFARDPEYPASSAHVQDLLARCDPETEPTSTIEIPDAFTADHLTEQARRVDGDTLPAGAAEFFAALLQRNPTRTGEIPAIAEPRSDLVLMVCGSQVGWSTGRGAHCLQHGVPVVPIPRRLFDDDFREDELHHWAEEVHHAFCASTKVMIAIGGEKIEGMPQAKLIDRLARAVERITKLATLGSICLEGGATAIQVMQHLGWSRLQVGKAVSFGLSPMEVIGKPAPQVYIKPGSYLWPEGIWEL